MNKKIQISFIDNEGMVVNASIERHRDDKPWEVFIRRHGDTETDSLGWVSDEDFE